MGCSHEGCLKVIIHTPQVIMVRLQDPVPEPVDVFADAEVFLKNKKTTNKNIPKKLFGK